MVAAIAVCVLAVIMSSELPYSAYISNFANLESFVKLFQRKFWHFEVEPRWRRKRWLYLSTSRRWMETIQGPTYLIHKERSWKKYPRLQYPQQTRKLQLYFSHQLAAWRRSGLLVNVVTMDHCFNLEGRHCFSTSHHLQLVDKCVKSASDYYRYHVYAPAGNSIIVGAAYWAAHSWNYLNEILKNSYSRKFRPTKYKRYTVCGQTFVVCPCAIESCLPHVYPLYHTCNKLLMHYCTICLHEQAEARKETCSSRLSRLTNRGRTYWALTLTIYTLSKICQPTRHQECWQAVYLLLSLLVLKQLLSLLVDMSPLLLWERNHLL